jgi:hypothetical protein
MARLDAAASTANTKVLAHPAKSRAVVHSHNYVGTAVIDFQGLLGIESSRQSVEVRRWADAVTDVRDKALEAGAARSTIKRLCDTGSSRTPSRLAHQARPVR